MGYAVVDYQTHWNTYYDQHEWTRFRYLARLAIQKYLQDQKEARRHA